MVSLTDEGIRAASPRLWLAMVVEKVTLLRREPDMNAHFEQHVARLALTAPHVLADIGFVRDDSASSLGRTVWRRGRTRVTVAPGAPSVSIETD